jgi:hypothetical protein
MHGVDGMFIGGGKKIAGVVGLSSLGIRTPYS